MIQRDVAKSALLVGSVFFAVTGAAAQTGMPPNPPQDPTRTQASASAQGATATNLESQSGLDDIIVTAQRRSENLQKVPIAVSTATQEQLFSVGASTVSDIKLVVPGADVLATNGYVSPFIRGVGSRAFGPGIENPIAIYVDGVYYANAAASLFGFNNIEQVAVLKGPQGTLFGRNATGGLIQITTREPEFDFGGEAAITYGNYDTGRIASYVTGGLSPDLAVDLALQYTRQGDGYGTNLVTGNDVYRVYHDISLRSKWLFKVGDRTEIRLTGDFSDNRNNLNAQRVLPGTTTPPNLGRNFIGAARDISADTDVMVKTRDSGVSVKLDHDLDFAKLVSITAYRKSSFFVVFDFDVTSAVFRRAFIDQGDRQLSQELQLQSQGSGELQWLVGAYYFDSRSRYRPALIESLGAAISPVTRVTSTDTRSIQEGQSFAGFAQLTWALTPRFHLTGGLRYTTETRKLDASITSTRTDGTRFVSSGPVDLENRFKKLTWRLSGDYQFTPDVLGYVSYNRGFKSGGFNPGTLTLPAFEPEVLDAYEAGLKTTLLNRTLRINGAAFYYDYQDIQVQRVVVGGMGSTSGIANGAKAEIYGGEIEVTAEPIDSLQLTAGYQYLHGRYKQFANAIIATPNPAGGEFLLPGDVSGNRTVVTPTSQINATATYTIALGTDTLKLSGNFYHNSGFFAEPDNVLRQPSYSLFGATAAYTFGDRITVAGWVSNLGDKTYTNYLNHQSTGPNIGLSRVSYAAPRTYGATVSAKF